MRRTWVATKTTKIGAKKVTDSLTPLRLRITSMTMRNATNMSLYFWKERGRKLKIASPHETRETAIVSI